MKKFISCLAVSTALVCSVRAQEPTGVTHVNLGLFDPVQIADSTDDVKGFQLGLFWDRTRDMTGLSIAGIGNVAGGCMTGVDAKGKEIVYSATGSGVLNFIRNSPLPFFPIVNAHF